MGRRILRRHNFGYSVCPYPIKRMSGFHGSKAQFHMIKVPHFVETYTDYTFYISPSDEILGSSCNIDNGLNVLRQNMI